MSRASFCTECGARLPEAVRFCTQCGKAVPAGTSAAPPVTPQPSVPSHQIPEIPGPPPVATRRPPPPPIPGRQVTVPPPMPPPVPTTVPARPSTDGPRGIGVALSRRKGLFGCLAAVLALGVIGLVIVVILAVWPDGQPEGPEGGSQTDLAGGEAPAEAVVERLGPEQPVDPLLAVDPPVTEEEAARRLDALSSLVAGGHLGEVPALPEVSGED